jgi:hypothetical protein
VVRAGTTMSVYFRKLIIKESYYRGALALSVNIYRRLSQMLMMFIYNVRFQSSSLNIGEI